MRRGSMLAAAAAVLLASAFAGVPARAADVVRAGKAVSVAWAFVPLDVGAAAGIWAKYGIDLQISSFAGDARLQQALASDSIDFGLGSGPAMAFIVKGAPVMTVAAFAGEPRNLAVVVGADSPIHSVADIKGKLIAVTTVGSLTDWLAKRLSMAEGWGPDGVRTIALGAFEAFVAAMKTHQVDALMVAVEAGYMLEERNEGRLIVGMDRYVPHFHTHVIFARQALIDQKPELTERFLKGFFASIAFMKANREKTIEVSMQVLNQSRAAMEKTYDYEISMLLDDGHFDPEAVSVLKDSFVGMGILPERPRDDQIFTTKFVPVKLP